MTSGLREKILNWAKPWVEVPAAGLDISDLSIKFLKFRQNKNISIEFFGESTIPEGIIANGEIKNEDELAKILRALTIKEKRLRFAPIVASLPEEKSFLRLVQLPKVDRGKVEAAVRWEIEANIPVSPEELWYDHEIIETQDEHIDHLDVVVTAFPRKLVESYVSVFKKAGFLPVALELESQAVVRAAINDLRSREANIVVDVGGTRTGISVVSGGAIIFTTTAPISGMVLEKAAAKSLGIDQTGAAVLLKEKGIGRSMEDGKIFSALLPSLNRLADEIRRAMEYYAHESKHSHGVGPAISSIFLVGGAANLAGLDTFLSVALKIPVHASDPFVAIRHRLDTVVPSITKESALSFATAIGLALWGISN